MTATIGLTTAIKGPSKTYEMVTESMPVSGVETKNEVVAALDAPERLRPTAAGITPHEHNGSGAPNKAAFTVSSLSKALGYTYSQLYHRLMKLTGKSPNNFIKEFKLHKALVLLYKQQGNITEVASKTGFNSPTYFSDCFFS